MLLQIKALAAVLLAAVLLTSASAQWIQNGVPICDTIGWQHLPVITTDMRGGGIVAWADNRNQATFAVYVQRIDSLGYVRWGRNGVALCDAAGSQV
jgi:hypothetical protein